jgi:uncharacterized protein (DUF1330 family)
MLKSALLVTAGIIVGAGAIQVLNAATGPQVYSVFEANVTDEAAYTKALPDVQKILKENGGVYIAGGFNKAKLVDGKTPVGNRYVILRWDNEEAFTKAQNGGVEAWIKKNAPEARQIMVEGIAQ